MTLNEATRAGHVRLRRSMWANPHAYLRLDLFPGGLRGPWLHLYDRPCQEAIGEPTPQTFLGVGDAHTDYVVYDGPRDTADTCGPPTSA